MDLPELSTSTQPKRLAVMVPNIIGWAPGQRLRVESWAHYLEAAGWRVDFYPFEDAALHRALYEGGTPVEKATRLLRCLWCQAARVTRGIPCDVLLIHREAALIGPALIERLAAWKLGVPVVFDLDDPIFVPYRSPLNGWFSYLKFSKRKTRALFRLSAHVIAINEPIASYARRYSDSVSVVPNCVDTLRYQPGQLRAPLSSRIVWIGSASTAANLTTIAKPLGAVQAATGASVRIIGSDPIQLPGVGCEFRRWTHATEVADLADCDIGVVPASDLPWNHWKFNFKTLQYMAMGLPVVARRIGSNAEMIEHGVSGFLVDTETEWRERLTQLVEDPDLRRAMGGAARKAAVERYSVDAQMPRVVALFDALLDGRRLRVAQHDTG